MPGTRTFTTSFLLLAGLAAAATPDYFPLEAGNQWIYRGTGRAGAAGMTIEVTRSEVLNGRTYSLVRGFPSGEVWLRMADGGTMYAYDPKAGQEGVWVAFDSPEGAEYDTVIDPCNRRARIESRSARYSGPIGEFAREALRVVYPPSGCADAGITEEIYLPWVGLVRRTITTIAGPVTYDLIYAKLGGVTVISGAGASFSLHLDRVTYYVNLMPPVDPRAPAPEMTAQLTLRNATPSPLELVFPSGQSYDLVIRNDKGETVYQWSDGKAFTMVFRNETLAAGAERNYVVTVSLAGKDGKPLPQGRYTAEGWFATEGGRRYAATMGFEIKNVY